jgi:hypothetical protein
MATRIRAATAVGSCPDCLSWGPSYGLKFPPELGQRMLTLRG